MTSEVLRAMKILILIWVMMMCSLGRCALKVEAVGFSEMLETTYKTTWHHNPEILTIFHVFLETYCAPNPLRKVTG
jgi:hypothetical protein